MKTLRNHAVIALLVVGCRSPTPPDGEGPGGTPGTPPPTERCTNALSIPEGYPPLGGACRAHLRIAQGPIFWPTDSPRTEGLLSEEFISWSSDQGVRPIPGESRYDLGWSSPEDPFSYDGLFLPSVAVGRYRASDGAAFRSRLGGALSELATDNDLGNVDVQIVGEAGGAIWGRFLARACMLDEGCQYLNGTFSAVVESAESELRFGYPSEPAPPTPPDYCWESADECSLPPEVPPDCYRTRCVARRCDILSRPSCV